jgi:phosphate-selective porin OprO/OprP
MGYDIDMNERHIRTRLPIAVLVVALLLGGRVAVRAQDATQVPVPVPTPTPTPSPAPIVETPAPAPTPEPSAEPAPVDAGSGETGDEPEPGEPDDETPKGEQVTNPGAVAFTDYRPFDLDEIVYEPVKTKWGNFVNALRGISRYNLFDGKVKFRLGGKAQFDATDGSGDDTYDEFYGPIETDFSLRRFELFAAGRIRRFNFNLEFELGPDWGISDAWIEGAEGGLEVWGHYLGKLRVGWMNEPFSLERQTSGYNLGLMERSLPIQTIAPGSNIGAMVHDSGPKGRFTWAFGLFSFGQKNDANASTSALSVTGRYTFLPVYRDEGRDLLHFGISLSSRSPIGGDTRYRSRPEARFVDYLVDTGGIDAGHVTLAGLEVAAVRGPLWLAAEHIRSQVSAQAVDDPTFKGSYVQVGWFLTGESRPFRTNSGTFDRLRPVANYTKGNPFKKKNGGAWELVGRFSTVDLSDGLVEGGELTDISAALSWYPNAIARIQLNYIHARTKDQGSANVFLLRVQYHPW